MGVSESQPEADGLRRDPPVCCYCDNDLSCGHCGMEQPYDDVSLLKARVEELTKALDKARSLLSDGDLAISLEQSGSGK